MTDRALEMKCQEEKETAAQLTAAVCGACVEAKGKELSVLDVSEVFSLADYFVIVSGRSDRQVQGIADKILSELAAQGIEPLAIEGMDKAHWVLIDFGDVLVHIFYESVRELYNLESLWINARSVNINQEFKIREANLQAA